MGFVESVHQLTDVVDSNELELSIMADHSEFAVRIGWVLVLILTLYSQKEFVPFQTWRDYCR